MRRSSPDSRATRWVLGYPHRPYGSDLLVLLSAATLFNLAGSTFASQSRYDTTSGLSLPSKLPWRSVKALVRALLDSLTASLLTPARKVGAAAVNAGIALCAARRLCAGLHRRARGERRARHDVPPAQHGRRGKQQQLLVRLAIAAAIAATSIAAAIAASIAASIASASSSRAVSALCDRRDPLLGRQRSPRRPSPPRPADDDGGGRSAGCWPDGGAQPAAAGRSDRTAVGVRAGRLWQRQERRERQERQERPLRRRHLRHRADRRRLRHRRHTARQRLWAVSFRSRGARIEKNKQRIRRGL